MLIVTFPPAVHHFLYLAFQKFREGSNFHRTFITFTLFSYSDLSIFRFFLAYDQHIGDAFQLVVANLTTDFLISVIHDSADLALT